MYLGMLADPHCHNLIIVFNQRHHPHHPYCHYHVEKERGMKPIQRWMFSVRKAMMLSFPKEIVIAQQSPTSDKTTPVT